MKRQLSPQSYPAYTREQLRRYADASGDHNPIHLDENFAKQAGFPGVIVHGMLSMAVLGDYIVRHFPTQKFELLRFRCRFRKVTFPGDAITCEGTVTERADSTGSFTVQLQTKNQNGDLTCEGEASLRTLES